MKPHLPIPNQTKQQPTLTTHCEADPTVAAGRDASEPVLRDGTGAVQQLYEKLFDFHVFSGGIPFVKTFFIRSLA